MVCNNGGDIEETIKSLETFVPKVPDDVFGLTEEADPVKMDERMREHFLDAREHRHREDWYLSVEDLQGLKQKTVFEAEEPRSYEEVSKYVDSLEDSGYCFITQTGYDVAYETAQSDSESVVSDTRIQEKMQKPCIELYHNCKRFSRALKGHTEDMQLEMLGDVQVLSNSLTMALDVGLHQIMLKWGCEGKLSQDEYSDLIAMLDENNPLHAPFKTAYENLCENAKAYSPVEKKAILEVMAKRCKTYFETYEQLDNFPGWWSLVAGSTMAVSGVAMDFISFCAMYARKSVQVVCSSISDFCSGILDSWRKLPAWLKAVTGVAGVGVVWLIARGFCNTLGIEMHTTQHFGVKQSKAWKKAKWKKMMMRKHGAQFSKNDYDLASKLMATNTLLVVGEDEKLGMAAVFGVATFVSTNMFIFPLHSFISLTENLADNNGRKYYFSQQLPGGANFVYPITEEECDTAFEKYYIPHASDFPEVLPLDSKYLLDFVVVKANIKSLSCRKFANIIERFVSINDLAMSGRFHANLIAPMVSTVNKNVITKQSTFSSINVECTSARNPVSYEEIYCITNHFRYTGTTYCGQSGSPLITGDSKFPEAKIIGIHIGSHSSTGFSVAVYKEYLLAAMDCVDEELDLDESIQQSTVAAVISTEMTNLRIETGHGFKLNSRQKFIGVLDKSRVKFPVLNSKLEKSKAFGLAFKTTVHRARLGPTITELLTGKDVWAEARMKYARNDSRLDRRVLFEICDFYWMELLSVSTTIHDDQRRPLTWTEVLEGTEFICSVPLNTSAGFPDYVKHTKKYTLLGKQHPVDQTTDVFLATKARFESLWRDCEGVSTEEEAFKIIEKYELYFNDFPKDEVIDLEKEKCRVISAISLLGGLLEKMCVGMFVSWLRENKIHNRSAVGMDACKDSQVIKGALHLGDPDWRPVGGDHGGWDTDFELDLHETNKRLEDYFYRGSHAGQRFVCHIMRSKSTHVTVEYSVDSSGEKPLMIKQPFIYRNDGSQSSGTWTTADYNTLGNNVSQLYVNCEIVREARGYLSWDACPKLEIMTTVFTRYKSVSFGDDFKCSVHKDLPEVTCLSMQKKYSELGHRLTSPLKGSFQGEFLTPEENIFLQRIDNWSELGYSMVLLPESTFERFNWTANKRQELSIMKLNIPEAAKELANGGKEYFAKYSPVLDKICEVYECPRIDFESAKNLLKKEGLQMHVFRTGNI